MKRYRYKVRTGKGAIMSGVLLAEHKGEALQVLKGEHDRILSLKEDWFSVKGTRQHFSDGERERLFKELGILLKSEIPILRALDIMGLRGNAKVAFLCRRIGEELKKGRSLSKALLRYEQAIGALAPVLLEAGEKRFYNLFWGAKVTVQMRVLSAPTFFNKKNRHMHSNPLQLK